MSDARIRGLDGLRAIAVGLVVTAHALRYAQSTKFVVTTPGQTGVRLFFVLSGFLITGILLEARARAESRGISRQAVWRAFFVRRALRIFPLAYLALGVAYVLSVPAAREHGWWYATYLQNVNMASRGSIDRSLGHFWSLAVEEQFYAVWPFFVLWTPRRLLPAAMMVLVIASGIVRGVMVAHGFETAAYVLAPSRFDALAFGGWLSCSKQSSRIVIPLILGGLGLFNVPASGGLAATLAEWGSIAVSGAVVVAVSRSGFASAWLSWRPLAYLGVISYGIYVWHPLVPEAVHFLEQRFDIWLRFPAYGFGRLALVSVFATAAASLSWRYLESPLNDLKRHFPYVREDGAKRSLEHAPLSIEHV